MDIIKIIADTAITGSGGTPQDNACKYIGGCTDENQFSGKLQAILNWIFSIIWLCSLYDYPNFCTNNYIWNIFIFHLFCKNAASLFRAVLWTYYRYKNAGSDAP